MPREFLPAYALPQDHVALQRAAIDFLLGLGQPPVGFGYLAEVSDPLTRVDLLAQALATGNKDYARAGERRQGGLPQLYRSKALNAALAGRQRQMAALGLLPTLPDLAVLPAGSFGLHFTFTLRTPYISKDDASLHILDNPVRKDKVFGLPMVASTGWKGALRAALRQINDWNDEHPDLQRLFGHARDDETGPAGRLFFYSTFFTRFGLEVINPHDRQSNAGKQPIYFESVPPGAEGDFILLYVPFDRVGEDERETQRQAADDLMRAVAGIETMLTRTGFGAKTSSGFGLAELAGDGQLVVHDRTQLAERKAVTAASLPPIIRSFASFAALPEIIATLPWLKEQAL